MDLEREAAEPAVGDFSLNLIGRDKATGDVVIIENQLQTSSQGHPSQLLTYAGGVRPSPTALLKAVFAINLDWLHKKGAGAPGAVLERLVASLTDLPGVAERWTSLGAQWRKRPSIPAAALFGRPDAAQPVRRALLAL